MCGYEAFFFFFCVSAGSICSAESFPTAWPASQLAWCGICYSQRTMEQERKATVRIRETAATATGDHVSWQTYCSGSVSFLPQQSLNVLTSIASASLGEAVPTARHLHWECGCVRGRGEAWLCCDEKGQGRLGVITIDDKAKPRLEITSCKVTAHHTTT